MTAAKKEADRLFAQFYFVLFDSDTDKGEECTVSILAIRCALIAVDEQKAVLENMLLTKGIKEPYCQFFEDVKSELHKL